MTTFKNIACTVFALSLITFFTAGQAVAEPNSVYGESSQGCYVKATPVQIDSRYLEGK